MYRVYLNEHCNNTNIYFHRGGIIRMFIEQAFGHPEANHPRRSRAPSEKSRRRMVESLPSGRLPAPEPVQFQRKRNFDQCNSKAPF